MSRPRNRLSGDHESANRERSVCQVRCAEDDRLFRAGSAEAVGEACRRLAVGKLLRTALYVHRTALEALDPLLRVYEGCARAHLGTLDGSNLIKLHRHSSNEEHRDLSEPFMAAIAELRRLPSLALRLVRDQGRNWRQRSRLLTYPQPVSSGKLKK
jgi:hypothetical protein